MIKTKGRFQKLPYKLTLVFAVFGFVVLLFAYLVLTGNFQEKTFSDFYARKDILTRSLVSNARYELLINEKKRTYNTLKDSSRLKEFKYLVLTDDTGKVLFDYNLSFADSFNYSSIKAPASLPINTTIYGLINPLKDYKLLRDYLPISVRDNLLGKLYFGISIENLSQEISEYNFNLSVGGLFLFFLSVILVYVVTKVFTRPIDNILMVTEEISSGRYGARSNYLGENQIGDLAHYVNRIAHNIETMSKQNESLNRQLKVVMKDKLGELNFEINQRRMAEFSLKKSEEQFRLMFELAPIGMFISSTDRVIKKVNQAFCSTVGYSEEELTKTNYAEITYPDDQMEDLALHNELLNNKVENITFEKRFITKNNKVIYAILKSVLLRDEKNKPLHFIEQILDITERKRTEQELIAAKEKAEESDRLKTAFLAQMSHEIRTPLNIILNATPLIADEFVNGIDDDTAILLDSVNSAGKRLQRTIDMILNMSSIQSGNYKPDNEMIDINVELRKLVEEFKPLCQDKNLGLFFFNETKEAKVYADRYTVIQSFQNLIHNSIKYTIRGKIDVVIFKDEENHVNVNISDTGIGMSEDYLSKLFHPFSQEDTGHKREFEGNGLGLALVKKYLDLNQAEILVKSKKEVGSTFTVTFDNQNGQIA